MSDEIYEQIKVSSLYFNSCNKKTKSSKEEGG